MQAEWAGYWAAGRTGFHRSQIHPMLERYLPRVVQSATERVVVPLCGKTLDLPWLESRTAEVVGCEWVPQAITEFFGEQDRNPTIEELNEHRRHRSGRLSIIEGDFLTLNPREVGQFDLCWDRAAMIALPPTTREEYVPHLISLMKPNGRILLVTYDADKPADSGPPYPILQDEVRTLYSDFGKVELLESLHYTPETDERLRAKGLDWVREDVFHITITGA